MFNGKIKSVYFMANLAPCGFRPHKPLPVPSAWTSFPVFLVVLTVQHPSPLYHGEVLLFHGLTSQCSCWLNAVCFGPQKLKTNTKVTLANSKYISCIYWTLLSVYGTNDTKLPIIPSVLLYISLHLKHFEGYKWVKIESTEMRDPSWPFWQINLVNSPNSYLAIHDLQSSLKID